MADTASHMDNRAAMNNTRTVGKPLLKIFTNLYVKSEKQRNESCVRLVRHLAEHTSATENDGLSADLKYCLKRLVRGLGGSLQDLQKSNFTALVAVLHSFPSVTFDILNKIVESELNGQDITPGEEGGIFTGRILAMGAVIRCGLFKRSTIEVKLTVTKALISNGQKKSYLSNVASPFLLDLIRNSNEDVFVKGVWPVLEEAVAKPWAEQNLDTLLILLAILASHPSVVTHKQVQKWLGTKFLSAKAMPYFAEKLLVVNGAVNLEHPFYEEFTNILCSNDHKPMLDKFWTVEVSKLISASRNKELATLHILSLLLKKIPDKGSAYILATIPILHLISRTLYAPFVERQRFPDLYVKARAAQSALEGALTSADVSDKERLELVHRCLVNPKLQTATHLITLLQNKLSKDGVQTLAQKYCSIVLGDPLSDEQQLTIKDKMFAAQQLARLTCLQICANEVEWKVKMLIFLSEYGLFSGHSNDLNVELAATLKQSFFQALDQKFSSLEEISQVLVGIVKHLNGILHAQSESLLSLREPFEKSALSSWEKMFKTVLKLEKKRVSTGKDGSLEQIFLTLFLFMGLELFTDASMAHDALDDIQECYLRHKKGEKEQKDSGEPAWVEVTVELLLSFLSRDSHMTRTVVCAVFPRLSKHLTASSFCQILKVLDPTQGENPLSTPQEESDDSSDDESVASDSALNRSGSAPKRSCINGNGAAKGENVSDFEDDSSEDDDEEDNDPHEEEELLIDKLRMELHNALGDSAALTDTESVDVDDIDEEEGERMNAALGQAFKSFNQSKPSNRKKNKENIKKEETVSHFRIRVLDLVELYLSHEPSMALCLESMTPLLNLYSFCTRNKHRKSLETRVKCVLGKLTGLKKFSSIDSVTGNLLAEKIEYLTAKGIKASSTFPTLADLVVDCCTFVVRCSIFLNAQNKAPSKTQQIDPVVDVYKAMLSEFFTKRDTLLPVSLFKAVFQLNWVGCWVLLHMVVEKALDDKVRVFSRRQALVLLTVIFRNIIMFTSADSIKKKELQLVARRLGDHAVELLTDKGKLAALTKGHKQFLAELCYCLAQILSRPEVEFFDKSALLSALSGSTSGVSKELRKALNLLTKRCSNSSCPANDSKNKKTNSRQDEGGSPVHISSESGKMKKKSTASNGFHQTKSQEEDAVCGGIPKGHLKKLKKNQILPIACEDSESISFGHTNGHIVNGNNSDDDVPMDHQNGCSEPLNGSSEMKRKVKHTSLEVTHGKKRKKKH